MHKFLIWIITDPASLHFKGRPSQYRSSVSGQVDINGFPLNVVAVFRCAFAVFSQFGVGFRAAISGDYVKRFSRFEFYGDAIKQVQQMSIYLLNVLGAKIPHNVVYIFQRIANIFSVAPVNPAKMILGVRIVQR